MPLRPDDSNSLSDGRGMEPRAFQGLSFMSTRSMFQQPLGLQCPSTAAPSRPLLRCRLQLAALSVAFSCLFYKPPYDTALFMNAAGFPTRLNSSSQGFCFICLCSDSSGRQRGCLAHGLLNESKRVYPR